MRYRKWGIEKKIHTAKSHIRGRNPATTDPPPPCVPIIKQGKESNKPSSKGLYVASVASVISPAVTWHTLLQPHLQQQVSCWLWWQPGGNHSFPLCNCLDYKEWESGFCFIIYSSSSLFSFPLRVMTCTYPGYMHPVSCWSVSIYSVSFCILCQFVSFQLYYTMFGTFQLNFISALVFVGFLSWISAWLLFFFLLFFWVLHLIVFHYVIWLVKVDTQMN